MKAVLLVGVIAIATALSAQTAAPVPADRTNSSEIIGLQSDGSELVGPSSETLAVELIRGLDARKVEPGDIVVARCTQTLDFRGKVVIPKNAKIVGHIVEVQAKGRGKSESILGITFDKAVLRDGRVVPLIATIQALAPPATLAAEVGDPRFDVRVAPPKPGSAGLLPGAVKTVAPRAAAGALPSALDSNTTGIIGLNGLELKTNPSSAAKASVIHSGSQNVRLESGTRLILRVSLP